MVAKMNTVKTAIENIEKELATLKELEVKIDTYFACTRTYREIGMQINSIKDVLEEMKENASYISNVKEDIESMIEDAQDEIDDAQESLENAQHSLNVCYDKFSHMSDISDICENISNLEELIIESEEVYNSIDIRDAYEQICDILNDDDETDEAF